MNLLQKLHILKSLDHTQLIVPAETVKPSSLNTGSDSPVSIDSSTTLLPPRTLPCTKNISFSETQYCISYVFPAALTC